MDGVVGGDGGGGVLVAVMSAGIVVVAAIICHAGACLHCRYSHAIVIGLEQYHGDARW